MSDPNDENEIKFTGLPYLIRIFLAFADRLPEELGEKAAAAIRDYRNRLAHDSVFARDPGEVEEFLRLTDRYLDKSRRVRYAMHVGADVESRLKSAEAHERGHAAIPWAHISRTKDQPKPPAVAEFILRLLLSGDDVDAITGDLTESYVKRYERSGEGRARVWFYGQVTLSMWPLLRHVISRRWLRGIIRQRKW